MNESELLVNDAAIDGASPMPASFFWALWIPAFCAMIWGMMVLFGVKPGPVDD